MENTKRISETMKKNEKKAKPPTAYISHCSVWTQSIYALSLTLINVNYRNIFHCCVPGIWILLVVKNNVDTLLVTEEASLNSCLDSLQKKSELFLRSPTPDSEQILSKYFHQWSYSWQHFLWTFSRKRVQLVLFLTLTEYFTGRTPKCHPRCRTELLQTDYLWSSDPAKGSSLTPAILEKTEGIQHHIYRVWTK